MSFDLRFVRTHFLPPSLAVTLLVSCVSLETDLRSENHLNSGEHSGVAGIGVVYEGDNSIGVVRVDALAHWDGDFDPELVEGVGLIETSFDCCYGEAVDDD